jgi:hypothetical protein
VTGRRSFAAALLVLAGLSALAIVGRAGGETETSDVPDERRLDGVRTALMPLLEYVREGQPRDALKELSGASGSSIGPAVLQTIRDGATSALANLEQLEQTTAKSPGNLTSIKAATSLYAEAAGLAEDASQGAHTARAEFATIGGRLLRYADALFDQARRLGGEGLTASAIRLDTPEPVPGIGPSVGPAKESGKAVSIAARCLRGERTCSEGPELPMAAAGALHEQRDPSDESVRREIAFRVWAESEHLAMTLAKPDSPNGDRDRARRLRAIAREILQTDGGR